MFHARVSFLVIFPSIEPRRKGTGIGPREPQVYTLNMLELPGVPVSFFCKMELIIDFSLPQRASMDVERIRGTAVDPKV